MTVFILLWLYIYLTFQVCPFFWAIVDKNALDEPFYLYASFLFCLILNFIFSFWKENFNKNIDLLYKFSSFLFKPFGFIFTFIVCEIKKFYNFLKLFKYDKIKILFKFFFKFLISIPGLIWRPLFKKWSYFGYFRSNKSKWYKR